MAADGTVAEVPSACAYFFRKCVAEWYNGDSAALPTTVGVHDPHVSTLLRAFAACDTLRKFLGMEESTVLELVSARMQACCLIQQTAKVVRNFAA